MPYHSNNTLHLKRVTNLLVLHFLAGGGAPRVPLVWPCPLPPAWPLLWMQQDTWMSPGLPVQELHRRSPLTLLLFGAVLTSPFLVSFCLWYPWLTGVLPAWVCTTCVAPRGLSAWGFFQKKWREAWSVASSEYQLF